MIFLLLTIAEVIMISVKLFEIIDVSYDYTQLFI